MILLEEDAVACDCAGTREAGQSLEEVVAPLAVHAPVVVIGPAEKRGELAGLIEAGAADFVERKTTALAEARGLIQRRLRQAPKEIETAPNASGESGEEDFGEVLRHELNNPLTGILGNAELLLAEIRRKKDGKIPGGGEQRLETIATLAVRLRETVLRLSENGKRASIPRREKKKSKAESSKQEDLAHRSHRPNRTLSKMGIPG